MFKLSSLKIFSLNKDWFFCIKQKFKLIFVVKYGQFETVDRLCDNRKILQNYFNFIFWPHKPHERERQGIIIITLHEKPFTWERYCFSYLHLQFQSFIQSLTVGRRVYMLDVVLAQNKIEKKRNKKDLCVVNETEK